MQGMAAVKGQLTPRGGEVPRGIPTVAESDKYPHLIKNQCGAINMAKYTPEQWLATGLHYCKECMTDPGQVAYHSQRDAYWDPRFNFMSIEPCPHGYIMTAAKLLQRVERKKRNQIVWGLIYAAIFFFMGIGIGPIGWGMVAVGIPLVIWRFRAYRRTAYEMADRLAVHPEMYGLWVKHGSMEDRFL